MTACPYCDFENIEGADQCEHCQLPLHDEDLREPGVEVARGLLRDRVHVLQPKSPVVVSPDMPAREVLQFLVEKAIGCVLVVEEDQLVGVFSERDALVKLNTQAQQFGDRPVSEFMTSKVETLDDQAKIAFAVQRMDLGSYRHVPIVDAEGRPQGVISARDILRYLTERSAESAAAKHGS